MERIRTEILPGVWLTALRTDKFKTAWLSVNLLTQLRRETAACTAVLPYVLRRGSTRLPDLETIAAELENLYGASITPSVRMLCNRSASFTRITRTSRLIAKSILRKLSA